MKDRNNPTATINGVQLTIQKKSAFEMAGYKKPVNFGDGSIGVFMNHLAESGKMKKLSNTLASAQQIWVCLSDCQACGRGCSDFQVCCRVCVEKTDKHDFTAFEDDEISTFRLPASEWVLYEATTPQAVDYLHQTGIYELIREIGYIWNENIRLHFDNEHECYDNDEWVSGKIYRLLLPVMPMKA